MSKKAKPTVTTSEPWKEARPYLLGDANKNITGVLPQSQKLFEQGGFTPAMQNLANSQSQALAGRQQDPRMAGLGTNALALGQNAINQIPQGQELSQGYMDMARGAVPDMMQGARGIANGAFDSNFGEVGDISAPQTNLIDARASQGTLDPTRALKDMLLGTPNNPYLDQQAAAMTSNLTRNLNENVMPGIRSEALASGQYGGSRQGIAEGLAASRMNQDLAPALAQMYGGAYENAQGRKYGTATGLNDQAFNNSTNNANRTFAADQFNANMELQNQQMEMAKNSANLGNRMQSLNVLQGAGGLMNNAGNMLNNTGGLINNASNLNSNALSTLGGIQSNANQMQDNTFGQQMNLLQMPQDYNWQNYNSFANPALQLGGMGGTQSQTNYKNPFAGALGGAASGAMMGSVVPGIGTAMGAMVGGGMGLLGGM